MAALMVGVGGDGQSCAEREDVGRRSKVETLSPLGVDDLHPTFALHIRHQTIESATRSVAGDVHSRNDGTKLLRVPFNVDDDGGPQPDSLAWQSGAAVTRYERNTLGKSEDWLRRNGNTARECIKTQDKTCLVYSIWLHHSSAHQSIPLNRNIQ